MPAASRVPHTSSRMTLPILAVSMSRASSYTGCGCDHLLLLVRTLAARLAAEGGGRPRSARIAGVIERPILPRDAP
jgi:hypothetical protein